MTNKAPISITRMYSLVFKDNISSEPTQDLRMVLLACLLFDVYVLMKVEKDRKLNIEVKN